MTTIRRHPVPTDSYDPKRPLNDLLVAQLEHFKHIAAQLPAELAAGVPPPPPIEDTDSVSKFIAAITKAHVSRKKALPIVISRRTRQQLPGTLALAASAESKPPSAKPKKSKPSRKS